MPRKKKTTTEKPKIVKLPGTAYDGPQAMSKEDAKEAIERAKRNDAAKAKRKARADAKKAKPTTKTTKESGAAGDELCTFAMRLPRSESLEIHQAAGPGKASQFVRRLAVAAARRDRKTVKEMIDGLETT